MDPKIVESELKNHKIRQGPIYKRTKFLQEWRERWMVLTMNYILIFTNRNLKELAEFIDLREVKTYKSYLRKEQDMIPAGFKIRTLEDMFYFCARNCNQKWTWIVSLQRLMDFKYAGKSPYNNAEWIKTKGFMGQRQFERGKFDQPEFYDTPKVEEKPKEVPEEKPLSKTQISSVSDQDLKNKMKQLDEQIQRIKERQQKLRSQEEMFLFELNNLKKAEESLKELQLEVEEKARLAEKIIAEGGAPKVVQHIIQENAAEEEQLQRESMEEKLQMEQQRLQEQKAKEQQENKPQIVGVVIQKTEEDVFEEPEHFEEPPSQTSETTTNSATQETKPPQSETVEKPQEASIPNKMTSSVIISPAEQLPQSVKKQQSPANTDPMASSRQVKMSKRISDMKNFFESKQMVVGPSSVSKSAVYTKGKDSEKKTEKKDQTVALHMCRDRVVVNLLEEFHAKAYSYPGLRFIIEFLVTICADRNLGYQSFLIREAKANQNRFLFAEVLLELINDYKKYDQFVYLAKIIEVLIFQAPGIFKLNHFDLIKRKLVDLLNHAPENHPELHILLKTMYVVHKMKNLQKSAELKAKLISVSQKMMSMEGKNWAKKLIEDQ